MLARCSQDFERGHVWLTFFVYSKSVDETVAGGNVGSSWFVSSTMGNMGLATATAAKAAMKRLEKFIVAVVYVYVVCSLVLGVSWE